ncbi:hypothetical protein GMSM_46240 [Geomonas sp. Red276]
MATAPFKLANYHGGRHCGFGSTVVSKIGKSWKDMWEMFLWNLS